MANPNLQLLVDAAKLLKPILGELVFVAGCTTALLITDKAAAEVRPTYDVDAIAEITSYVEYSAFSQKLRTLGFREDTREGAPLCRRCQETTTLDVMPLDGSILGFKNAWYKPAMATAEDRELGPDLEILMVNSVYFCATKLEALGDRGKNDYLGSRDLEDVIAVVDGRQELVREIQASQSDVRSYLGQGIARLLGAREFLDALPAHLAPDAASQARITTIMARLREISSL
jgi:predicted nucleotidyltransferase